jgi:hypothetical protein
VVFAVTGFDEHGAESGVFAAFDIARFVADHPRT